MPLLSPSSSQPSSQSKCPFPIDFFPTRFSSHYSKVFWICSFPLLDSIVFQQSLCYIYEGLSFFLMLLSSFLDFSGFFLRSLCYVYEVLRQATGILIVLTFIIKWEGGSKTQRQGWKLNSGEKDEIILNVESHHAQAKVAGFIFSIEDCAYVKVIAFGIAVGVDLHAISHLTCDFRRLLHVADEQYEPMKPFLLR